MIYHKIYQCLIGNTDVKLQSYIIAFSPPPPWISDIRRNLPDFIAYFQLLLCKLDDKCWKCLDTMFDNDERPFIETFSHILVVEAFKILTFFFSTLSSSQEPCVCISVCFWVYMCCHPVCHYSHTCKYYSYTWNGFIWLWTHSGNKLEITWNLNSDIFMKDCLSISYGNGVCAACELWIPYIYINSVFLAYLWPI